MKRLPSLICGYDPSRPVIHDPRMATKHVPMQRPGAKRKRSTEDACCYACGRPVIGYIPSPHPGGVPCCSVACARRVPVSR